MKGPSPCETFGELSAVPSCEENGSDEPPDVALGSYEPSHEPSHESYFHLKVHIKGCRSGFTRAGTLLQSMTPSVPFSCLHCLTALHCLHSLVNVCVYYGLLHVILELPITGTIMIVII